MKEYKARKSGLYKWTVLALVLIPVLYVAVWAAEGDSAQTLGESGPVSPEGDAEQDPADDPEAGIMPLAAYGGLCGTNVSWEFDDIDNSLTISGTGNMADYSDSSKSPWDQYKENITTVVIQDGVENIGNSAFSGCTNLTDVTIPESVKRIGQDSFYGCSSLVGITIPDSVTSIGEYAFNSCGGLTSVTIPSGVTRIEEHAFDSCSGLTSVTIPSGVTRIGNHAFSGCSGLVSITIPDSVTNIGDYAFSGCSGLMNITIPDSVTLVFENAFKSSNLKNVNYSGTKSQWDAIKIYKYSDPTETSSSISSATMNDIVSPATVHYLGEGSAVAARGKCGDSLTW